MLARPAERFVAGAEAYPVPFTSGKRLVLPLLRLQLRALPESEIEGLSTANELFVPANSILTFSPIVEMKFFSFGKPSSCKLN
jgi:hypothetical protein